MKPFLIILLLIIPVSVLSQKVAPIVNAAENEDWLQEIEKQELPGKLDMLKERWRADIPVKYHPNAISTEKIAYTSSRPLYLFVFDLEQLLLPTNPFKEEIDKVSKMLIPEKVLEVRIETDPKKTTLFGTRGRDGVIFVELSDKAVFSEISEALHPSR